MARDELRRLRSNLKEVAEFIDRIGRTHGRDKAFEWFLDDLYADITGTRKQQPPPMAVAEQLFDASRAYARAVREVEPFSDVLGDLYMAVLPGGKWMGQYFTPASVSDLLAQMQVPGLRERAAQSDGLVTVHDPACGAGALLLAIGRSLEGDTQALKKVSFSGIDKDYRAAMTAAVQLACVPVVHGIELGEIAIIHGNSLTMEHHRVVLHACSRDADPAQMAVTPAANDSTDQPDALTLP